MPKIRAKRKPQDLTQYSLRAIRRRLARSEERLDMLESALATNPKLWKAWSAEVRKPTK